MPRINLLPVKAARRAGTARNELLVFAGLVGGTLACLYFWYMAAQGDVTEMQTRIDELRKDITNVEKTVTRVEEFKKKSATLERKLAVIDTLKKQKIGPAKMLSDLADILTRQRKVWLTSLEEKDGKLTLKGGAMEQENVSEFQLALEQQSHFFHNVTLSIVNSAHEGPQSYFTWTLVCRTDYAAG